MKVVGVIGAGASGLCAAKHILDSPDMTPIVWEQSADVGGTWRLSRDVGVDKNGLPVHSSMYENLQTDIPKLLMGYPDYPLPEEEGEDFLHHSVVLKYLEDYAKKYDIQSCIKFGHRVENVSPVFKDDKSRPSWEVIVTSLKDGKTTSTICDALLVGNGHFSVPSVPDIDGIENFIGSVLHSHNYREPSPYTGKRVLVMGIGPSGLDIALELSSVAEQVYLAHRLPVLWPSELPPNILQVPIVKHAAQNGFVLTDGRNVVADAIIFCTGYEYKFPFLSKECGIEIVDNQVKPLYKQIVNAKYPSMALLGIPSRILVFPVVYYQVRFFLATITGQATLPSTEDMSLEVEAHFEDFHKKGGKAREYHFLQDDQFPYMDDLAAIAGLDQPFTFYQKMSHVVLARIFFCFPEFKKYTYKVSQDGAIVETKDGQGIKTGRDLTVLIVKQFVRLLWRDFFRTVGLIGSLVLKSIVKKFKG